MEDDTLSENEKKEDEENKDQEKMDQRKCSSCGSEIDGTDLICPNCGEVVPDLETDGDVIEERPSFSEYDKEENDLKDEVPEGLKMILGSAGDMIERKVLSTVKEREENLRRSMEKSIRQNERKFIEKIQETAQQLQKRQDEERERLDSRIEDIRKEKKELESEFKEEKKELRNKIEKKEEALKKQQDELREENKDIKSKIEKTREEHIQTKEDLKVEIEEKSEGLRQRLLEERDDLKKRLEEKKEELEEKIAERDGEIDELKNQIQKQREEYNQMKDALRDEIEEKFGGLRERLLEERDGLKESFEEDKKELEEKIADQETELQSQIQEQKEKHNETKEALREEIDENFEVLRERLLEERDGLKESFEEDKNELEEKIADQETELQSQIQEQKEEFMEISDEIKTELREELSRDQEQYMSEMREDMIERYEKQMDVLRSMKEEQEKQKSGIGGIDIEKKLNQPVFPFTAIVGQERMKRSLLLNAINPEINGVLIWGASGTAKKTAVLGLAKLLSDIEGLNQDKVNVWDDPERYMSGALVTSEANADYLIDKELNNGTLSTRSTNPSSDNNGPTLLVSDPESMDRRLISRMDKFSLHVRIETLNDMDKRIEISRRSRAFKEDPEEFYKNYKDEIESLRDRVIQTRQQLPSIQVGSRRRGTISNICAQNDLPSNMDVVIEEVARTITAYDGRKEVTEEDIQEALDLTLVHRVTEELVEEV